MEPFVMTCDLTLPPRASRPTWTLIAWGSLAAMSLGCGPPPPERVTVFGQVTYRGEPVAKGTISWIPLIGEQGIGASADIVQGAYRLESSLGPTRGNYRVEIQGYRATGRQVADLSIPDRSQIGQQFIGEEMPYLPAKYGIDSVLTATIDANPQELNYNLK
jgi:hypothetical protein